MSYHHNIRQEITTNCFDVILPWWYKWFNVLGIKASTKNWHYADEAWNLITSLFEWLVSSFVNSLAPGRFQFNIRWVGLKLTLVNDGWGIFYEIAIIWMSPDFTDDQSVLVQVMAWCLTAPSHNLSQCWPRSLSPFGVTRPEWVNGLLEI